MKKFRVMVKASIERPIIDGFNIAAEDAREAVDNAKRFFFTRLSLQGIDVLENDIEAIRVTNDCGEVIQLF